MRQKYHHHNDIISKVNQNLTDSFTTRAFQSKRKMSWLMSDLEVNL